MNLKALFKGINQLQEIIGGVVSSWVVSSLLVIIESRNFDASFGVIASVVGGIAGTAAILSVYLSYQPHPKDRIKESISFEVNPRARWNIVLSCLVALVLLYLYFRFAVQSNEICLLFLGLGVFILYRALTELALTTGRLKGREKAWKDMSPDEQQAWVKAQEEEKSKREKKQWDAEEYFEENEKNIKKWESDRIARTRDINATIGGRLFWARVWKLWDRTLSLRKPFHLITGSEALHEESRKLEIEQYNEDTMKLSDENFHFMNTEDILESKIKTITLEKHRVQYYPVAKHFKYFFLTEPLNASKAAWYLEALESLGKGDPVKFEFVIAIVNADIQLTQEGLQIFHDAGIHIHDHTLGAPPPPTQDAT